MSEVEQHWADKLVDEAIDLRDAGRVSEAVEMLKDVITRAPNRELAFLVLGGILWDEERREDALRCFQSAVKLNPVLEMASQGVFHVLMEMNEVERAFDEVRRFLALADSQDYRRIIFDLAHSRE